MDVTLDADLGFGIGETGIAYDVRPGDHPELWNFTNTYAWPKLGNRPAPVTLMPAVLHPDWQTTATGIFRRFDLSQFQQLGTTAWEEFDRLFNGDRVLHPKGTGGILQAVNPTGANCPLGVHLYLYGQQLRSSDAAMDGTGRVLTMQFGGILAKDRFTLNVFENGRATLSKGGDFTAYGGFGTSPIVSLTEGWIVPLRWGTIRGNWIKIFVVPHGYGLHIYSSTGDGFYWDDLPTVKPVAYPGVPPPLTQRALVTLGSDSNSIMQPLPILNHLPSGTMTPKQPHLLSGAYRPVGGESVFGITPRFDNYPSVLGTNQVSASIDLRTPAPPKNPKQVNIVPTFTLTQDPHNTAHTPHLYRVQIQAPTTVKPKPNAGQLLTDVIELRHTETKDGFDGALKIRNGQNHRNLRTASNLPVVIGSDRHEYIKCLMSEPLWEPDGKQEFLSWGLTSLMHTLEETELGSLTRLDGYTLSDATKLVLQAAGFPPDGSLWDVDDSPAWTLSDGEIDQKALNLPDVVKSAADWLRYLRDEYTSSPEVPFQWVMGFRPYWNVKTNRYQYRFYFKDPAGMDPTPALSLYPTHDLAAAMLRTPFAYAYQGVHRKAKEKYVEPEANWVQVVGLTMDDQPLYALKYDKKSVDPTVPLAARPSNWLGELRQVIDVNCGLVTQTDVNAACQKLFDRMSKAQYQVNFEAEWDPTVRMWDKVRLHFSDDPADYDGHGNDVGARNHRTHYQDYRIAGISVSHLQDQDTDPLTGVGTGLRPAQYTAMRLA